MDSRAIADARCAHCGSPMPAEVADARYCCTGCAAVAELLQTEGLDRYYELSRGARAPSSPPPERGHVWLEAMVQAALAQSPTRPCVRLDVQGLQCAACVWLMEELYRRHGGTAGLEVNPALGTATLHFDPGFPVDAWVRHVERFGYQFGPSHGRKAARTDALAMRLGICAALTVNVMLFSLSFYLGLSAADGDVFPLFVWLGLGLSTATALVGGWPFFSAALKGLRTGVLHLDLPIALGIALVWGVSVAQTVSGRGHLAYLDTLNVFITLMLLGRWLQARLVERNRRMLLDDDGADGLWVRRLEGTGLRSVCAPRIGTGDQLLIAPGDVVPVDGLNRSPRARVSTEWISGEIASTFVGHLAPVRAGSVNAGTEAFVLEATQDFARSPLVSLLRQPVPGAGKGAHATFWDALARRWVATVLGVSSVGFLLWLPFGLGRAVDVAAGLLVVTCPCAIGLAIPLAFELTQQRLRLGGFFARREDLLDRLLRVRTLLFDKTGTLTLGQLELSNPDAVWLLEPKVRDVAFNLVARSNHPVSRCLFDALERSGACFDATFGATEHPGAGLEWKQSDGPTWRLGRPGWALATHSRGDSRATVLSRDGQAVASFEVRELLRRGATEELAALSRQGLTAWLISGDRQERVSALADRLGLPPIHALGGLSPERKAEVVAQIDQRDTLYLGDGVNDALAFGAAYCAGTPAVDRPVLPARSDFFLLGEGLGGLRVAFEGARKLRATVQQLLGIALAYNVVAVSVGLAGGLTPLRAAVAMPLSTLSLLAFTLWRLGAQRRERMPRLALAGARP
ncbi:MAG: heavy metal translocating P-type ATPase metal-binding domain-containing protein [Myxococcaceae bacterium]|nr:heavy metal translocating P-type ATPase metal-binding domain-containing protein [Myxococcaceae bacterium]